MFDGFSIESYKHTYRVSFVSDAAETLRAEIRPGDVVLADRHVWALYPDLKKAVGDAPVMLIEPSEQAKSYEALAPIIQQLIEKHFTRNNRLIAVGGGVLQDITAFTASILFRGVKWVFLPTNLLTQCDSCIGSKTSINFADYKNQLGGFHPPESVYINLQFLQTLPEREIRSGLGEMMHYFLVSGESDFAWATPLVQQAPNDPDVLKTLIHRSLAIKKEMIERDEFDQGPRNVFNYGHSFGHALEVATQYEVPHGIAVSYGMDLANILSARLGLIPMSLRNRIRPVLETVWGGTSICHVNCDAFLEALTHDKKNEGNQIKVILTKGPGDMFKTTLEMNPENTASIRSFFNDQLYLNAL